MPAPADLLAHLPPALLTEHTSCSTYRALLSRPSTFSATSQHLYLLNSPGACLAHTHCTLTHTATCRARHAQQLHSKPCTSPAGAHLLGKRSNSGELLQVEVPAQKAPPLQVGAQPPQVHGHHGGTHALELARVEGLLRQPAPEPAGIVGSRWLCVQVPQHGSNLGPDAYTLSICSVIPSLYLDRPWSRPMQAQCMHLVRTWCWVRACAVYKMTCFDGIQQLSNLEQCERLSVQTSVLGSAYRAVTFWAALQHGNLLCGPQRSGYGQCRNGSSTMWLRMQGCSTICSCKKGTTHLRPRLSSSCAAGLCKQGSNFASFLVMSGKVWTAKQSRNREFNFWESGWKGACTSTYAVQHMIVPQMTTRRQHVLILN